MRSSEPALKVEYKHHVLLLTTLFGCPILHQINLLNSLQQNTLQQANFRGYAGMTDSCQARKRKKHAVLLIPNTLRHSKLQPLVHQLMMEDPKSTLKGKSKMNSRICRINDRSLYTFTFVAVEYDRIKAAVALWLRCHVYRPAGWGSRPRCCKLEGAIQS